MCFRSGLIQELSPLDICTPIFYSPKSHWIQSFLDQSGLKISGCLDNSCRGPNAEIKWKGGNDSSFPEMQGSVLLQLPSSCHLHLLEWPTPVTDEKWMWDLTDLFLSSWSCITRRQQAVSFVGPSSLDFCTLSHTAIRWPTIPYTKE